MTPPRKCSVSLEEAREIMATTDDEVLWAACNSIVNLTAASDLLTEIVTKLESKLEHEIRARASTSVRMAARRRPRRRGRSAS